MPSPIIYPPQLRRHRHRHHHILHSTNTARIRMDLIRTIRSARHRTCTATSGVVHHATATAISGLTIDSNSRIHTDDQTNPSNNNHQSLLHQTSFSFVDPVTICNWIPPPHCKRTSAVTYHANSATLLRRRPLSRRTLMSCTVTSTKATMACRHRRLVPSRR